MKRKIAVTVLAMFLFGLGWVAALIAQDTQPDFEIVVNAPAGETTIECVRGCNLSWVQRGLIESAKAEPKFPFSCGGAGATVVSRCSSGKVGGWITH